MVDIDTAVIQRVRDALLAEGQTAETAGGAVSGGVDAGHRQQTLERFTPFAETMFLVALADGEEAQAELDALRGAMHMLTGDLLTDDALIDIYQRCRHDVSEFGLDRCLERIGSSLAGNRMDRETGFTLAAAVALADNKVRRAESEVLKLIAEYFGISNTAMHRLLEDS